MQLHQSRPRAALSAGSAWDHFIQLRGGPIRTAAGWNFTLKSGQKLGLQNQFLPSKLIQTYASVTSNSEKEEESSPQSPGLGGRDSGATMESLRFEPVEIVGDSRVFRLGDLVILVQGFTTSRTGPVSRAGVVGCGGVRWFPSP
ncbi:hypothetical protein L3X38_041264 [Prunus dulcis]|uniref:Uncharacterized protein n=1 Tax=Prunus dulcis TaxID=3755 RepID=A0AAD4UUE9_PRUDU|nr:hypothetical protein L3X38_041264 [Prunus dulcis]